MASFYDKLIFSKGICYAEFFDIDTNELLAYSPYVTEFAIQGSMNRGDVSGGPGNALIMLIPDTARLTITAKTADSDLSKLRLPVGGELTGNAVQEVTRTVIADAQGKLKLTGTLTVPPGSGNRAPYAYVILSNGTDRAAIEAASGTPYAITTNEGGGTVDFEGIAGVRYTVRYFVQADGNRTFRIPALFAPKTVRAHFAINLYARPAISGGSDASMATAVAGGIHSGIVGRRHYYFPQYSFTAAYADSASNTETGIADLSGEALACDTETDDGIVSSYGYTSDEFFETSTSGVDGLFIIGEGGGMSLPIGATHTLNVKYSIGGVLSNVTDKTAITFTSDKPNIATVSEQGVITALKVGGVTITASVTNGSTGVTYTDSITAIVTTA